MCIIIVRGWLPKQSIYQYSLHNKLKQMTLDINVKSSRTVNTTSDPLSNSSNTSSSASSKWPACLLQISATSQPSRSHGAHSTITSHRFQGKTLRLRRSERERESAAHRCASSQPAHQLFGAFARARCQNAHASCNAGTELTELNPVFVDSRPRVDAIPPLCPPRVSLVSRPRAPVDSDVSVCACLCYVLSLRRAIASSLSNQQVGKCFTKLFVLFDNRVKIVALHFSFVIVTFM